MEYKPVILDGKVVSVLLHSISHLKSSLQMTPTVIKTIKWQDPLFEKEMTLEDRLNYINQKLDCIYGYLKIAQEAENAK